MSAPCLADTLEKYILTRNGSQNFVSQAQQINFTGCESTSTHLICVHRRKNPNVAKNPQSRQAILKNMALATRHDLYVHLLTKIKAKHLRYNDLAKNIFLDEVSKQNTKFLLKNVEFNSYSDNDLCTAVASIPMQTTESDVQQKYKEKFFTDEYCLKLLEKANTLINQQQPDKVLLILKEVHDLQFANADLYILTAKAFVQKNQKKEAEKLVLYVFEKYFNELNSNQANSLALLLIDCGHPEEAEKIYRKDKK